MDGLAAPLPPPRDRARVRRLREGGREGRREVPQGGRAPGGRLRRPPRSGRGAQEGGGGRRPDLRQPADPGPRLRPPPRRGHEIFAEQAYAEQLIRDVSEHKASTVAELLAFMRDYRLLFSTRQLARGDVALRGPLRPPPPAEGRAGDQDRALARARARRSGASARARTRRPRRSKKAFMALSPQAKAKIQRRSRRSRGRCQRRAQASERSRRPRPGRRGRRRIRRLHTLVSRPPEDDVLMRLISMMYEHRLP